MNLKKLQPSDFVLFDGLGVGVLIVDANSKTIEYANNEVANLTLFKTDELVGQKITKLFSDESEEQINDLMSLKPIDLNTSITEKDAILKRKSGGTSYVTLSLKKTESANKRIVTLIDSQPRRELESELENLYAQMIHTSKFLSLAEMAAGIAHEINNPLAIIHSYAEQIQLRESLGKLDTTKAVELSKKISEASMRASKIINSLKKLSRNDDEVTFSKVYVKDLIDEVVDLSKERILGHGVKFNVGMVPETLSITGNASQLLQILINLLENSLHAVKAMDTREINIDIEANDSNVNIRVSDTGPGIPKDIRTSIMNPFFTTKEVGKGTGLGLSISKMIAEKHRGRLLYEEIGTGACFCLEIPVIKENSNHSYVVNLAPEKAIQQPGSNVPLSLRNKNIKVLIVDDEVDLNSAIRFGLEHQGYKVFAANNGIEAMDILKTNPIDVVLTDVKMPQMDGYLLLKNIFKDLDYYPKVFFITGSSDVDTAKLFAEGAEGFFYKPVSLFKILQVLDESLLPKSKYFERRQERIEFSNAYEFDESSKNKSFNIGRGGMYISSKNDLPDVDSFVKFSINLDSKGATIPISGTGIVRWIRNGSSKKDSRGFGIEFYSFDDDNRQDLIEFLDSIKKKAFIPNR